MRARIDSAEILIIEILNSGWLQYPCRMKTDNTEGQRSKTVETAFDLLEHLKEKDGASLSELTAEFGKAKSTIYRYMTTLQHRGYVVKEGNTYYPSLRFLDFAKYSRNRKRAYILAKQKVEELAEKTEERAQFLVEENGKGVYVHRATGPHAVRTDPGIGKEVYLHTIAAGKAILAHLPQHRVEAILDEFGLPAVSARTITDRQELLNHLEEIQDRGFSFNKEESVEGLHAVGVPVMGPGNQVMGALSISGPSHRLKGDHFETDLPDQLLGTANELELNIAHS